MSAWFEERGLLLKTYPSRVGKIYSKTKVYIVRVVIGLTHRSLKLTFSPVLFPVANSVQKNG